MNLNQTIKCPMKILIVDDNDRVRRILRKMLAPITTDFCEAVNGFEAIEQYSRTHPDVVLMDIRMPLMNGIEATEQIIHADPSANVFIVTEYDDPTFRADAERAGAMKYFLKENLIALQDYLKTRWMDLN